MILADLEVFHSRAYSPTRRLALGRRRLPIDPAPGFGHLLLGGIVAVGAGELDGEDQPALLRLMQQLQRGERVVQPRIRNRFQTDHQGLARTHAMLIGGGEELEYDFEGNGSALQMTLAAVYAAGDLPLGARAGAFDVLRKALGWRGDIGKRLIAHLSGAAGAPTWSVQGLDPRLWALETLGLDGDRTPAKREVQRRYRALLREAHPDHGGEADDAADRIADLTEARRVLLG